MYQKLFKLFRGVLFASLLIIAQLFASAPTISSFSPTSGPVGSSVTITGPNFSTTPANNIVWCSAARRDTKINSFHNTGKNFDAGKGD